MSRADSMDHRAAVSPHSSTSSGSRGHAYAPGMVSNAYAPAVTGLGIGPTTSMVVPTSTAAQHVPASTWHQPASHFNSDLAAANRAWEIGGYLGATPANGLPGTGQSYPYQQRVPSLTGPTLISNETRFVPLHDYAGQSHPTSTS